MVGTIEYIYVHEYSLEGNEIPETYRFSRGDIKLCNSETNADDCCLFYFLTLVYSTTRSSFPLLQALIKYRLLLHQ